MTKTVRFNSGTSYWLHLLAPFAVAVAACLPAILVLTHQIHLTPLAECLAFGVAIVAAAFMLGWIGEAAELDLSGGLSVSILALVAILPEYVVSIYFSYAAGKNPSLLEYSTANLTGANRIVQGFGWPMVALIAYFAVRRFKARKLAAGHAGRKFGIQLDSDSRSDLGFLLIASALMTVVAFTGQMHLLIGVALVLVFGIYMWRVSGSEREEPELEGTAAYVGALPKIARRIFIVAFLLVAASVIFVCAEPFGTSLIEVGSSFGIDKYLLVQWLSPLASEAPEFTLAFIFAARGKQAAGLAILLSSKLNQWTLLAGSMPIAYVIGGGTASLPMTGRGTEEIWLTTTQTLLGIALLLGLRWGFRASMVMFGLFIASAWPDPAFRNELAWVHLAVALVMFGVYRTKIAETLKAPFDRPKH